MGQERRGATRRHPAGPLGRGQKEAFAKLARERNTERLRDELARRAAAIIAHADKVTAHAAGLQGPDAEAAPEWASWIC